MSTGDLLFIFAFIILPTIILVSCIWTLLLIRAGVLLPARRIAVGETGDDTQLEESSGEIEATGEPAVVIAAEPAPAGILPAIDASAALPAPEPLLAIESIASVPEPAPILDESTSTATQDAFEQTTDLPIIDSAMLEQADPIADAPAETVAPPLPQEPRPAQWDPAPEAPAMETPGSPEPELEVLFVPMPDDSVDEDAALWASNGRLTPDPVDDDEADEAAEGHSSPQNSRARRKPVRRVAQLRPSEDQASGVSPMGSLLRRSRSGNPR